MTLPTRRLGECGARGGAIALGTVKLGRAAGLKHAAPAAIPSDTQARSLLDAARALGVNLLDTAPAYGASEARLGALLAGQRDEWILSTKAGEEFDGQRSHYDFSPAALRASLERSLTRLRTDRVDILLLHSDGSPAGECARDDTIDALRRLRDEGKTRLVGASTHTPEGARRCLEALDVAMLALSAAHADNLPAIQLAHTLGKGVLIKKSLESGWAPARTADESARARAVADAIRFALTPVGVSSVVVGTTNPAHLREACAAAMAPV